MEGKLRIKRVPFSNFLLWLQSVQIPPHKFGCKGSKNFLSRNSPLYMMGYVSLFYPIKKFILGSIHFYNYRSSRTYQISFY